MRLRNFDRYWKMVSLFFVNKGNARRVRKRTTVWNLGDHAAGNALAVAYEHDMSV